MPFAKAQPQQAFIKMSMYGPPGSGKTFTALLMAEGLAKKMGKRIAFVDTERGTDFYAKPVAQRTVHPAAFEFDALYTRSLAEVLREVRALDTHKHGVIVIDSISHMWEAAMDAYTGKRTSQDGIPMNAWGSIKKPYKDMMRELLAMSAHVFILGRQKNVFEQDEGEQMRKVGVAIKAEGETTYEPHICVRLECRPSAKDQTQSTVYMYCEKDRSSVLQGRTIANPNFDTIAPVLDVLTDTVQAPGEDEDQRITDDSEIAAKEAAFKAEKSATLYSELSTWLAQAENAEALGVVVKAMKKQKKNLLEEHVEALRIALESATKRVNDKAIGAI
jgi:RecA/RadA recombinase